MYYGVQAMPGMINIISGIDKKHIYPLTHRCIFMQVYTITIKAVLFQTFSSRRCIFATSLGDLPGS